MRAISITLAQRSLHAGSHARHLGRCLLLSATVLLACGAAFGERAPAQEDPAVAAADAQVQANRALIGGAYAAFSRADIDSVMQALAPDIEWHVPGRGVLSRDYHGHQEVLGFFEHFMRLSAGTFQLRVDHIMAAADQVVVLCTESAERGGRKWSAPQVHVWTVRDGKAVAFREYEGDEHAEDEFWGPES
jgi:uncharacterized protein